MTQLQPLRDLQTAIGRKLNDPAPAYRIPARWVSSENDLQPINVNPYEFWHDAVSKILEQPATAFNAPNSAGGDWSRYATIYNMFVRTTTAFDHDGDGSLTPINIAGLRETGTFVKAICLLPYIKNLGCNTIHLLPITKIGRDGNKGDAGSPYAIRNPYELDDNLAEPALAMGVEAEFAAFVAAAHHLGIRIVLEFVFRTASKDADTVKQHPEWHYWIDAAVPDRQPNTDDEAAYGMPIFTPEEADSITEQVDQHNFDNLLPPHKAHTQMFLAPPRPEDVELVDGRWLASYPDGKKGRIPGAFADWPVKDSQPPWGDVTYLRLYDHPDFNYIAYSTIRMYDTRLAQPQHAVKPLWQYIAQIIPHYQTKFNVDGAMIDMGHALPSALKQSIVDTARAQNSNFAFWDENFDVTPQSVEEGYNAVMGSLPFILPNSNDFKREFQRLSNRDLPLPMFGAVENHNTPRAGNRWGSSAYVRYAFALAAFLPALPFVHNGLEIGERFPVNTGLGFTYEEVAQYPSEQLPLFSVRALDWAAGDPELAHWIQRTLALREQYSELLTDLSAETTHYLHSDNPHVFGILRRTADWSQKLALIVNSDMESVQSVDMQLPTGRSHLMDHYSQTLYEASDSTLTVTLPAGGCWWLEL